MMRTRETLITEHLGIWSAAVATKSSSGRGGNNKLELYGLKKLRELILELAVRGLLVPQDPQDEPASVLLKKIKAEKARLIKEGKIKEQKKLPPITEDEQPFDLPQGWEWCRFGDIYSLEYGKSLPESKRSGTGECPVYGSNGVVGSHSESCVKEPCIVVGRKGSAGALNLCLDNECWVTDVAYSVIPPSNLNIEFVFRQFHTLGLDKLGKGIKPGLNRNEAYMLKIAIPPLAEQHRIVAKVEELMALCERLEARQEANLSTHRTLVRTLLTALTDAGEQGRFEEAWARIAEHFDLLFTTEESIDLLKQSILQLAVMGRLVPQNPQDEPASALLKKIAAEKARLVKEGKIKEEERLPPIQEEEQPFKLPEGWIWSRIDEISLWVVDCLHSTPKFKETGRLCVDTNCIRPGIIIREKIRFVDEETFQERNRRMKPRKDDVLFSREGALLGIAVKVPDDLDFCIGQRMMIFRLNECVKSDYFERLLNSQVIRSQYVGKITGAASPHLNIRDIRKLYIPLPPTEEQHRIVARVDELMALCDRLQDRLRAARVAQQQLADAMAEQVREETV